MNSPQMSHPVVKVIVTDYTFDDLSIEESILEPLGCCIVGQRKAGDAAALSNLVGDADFVITQFAPIDTAVVAAMQKCRLIVRYGIGVDNVDLAAAAAKRIPVCNVPDYCTDEVADHTLAMILDLVRRITPNALHVRARHWGLGVRLSEMHSLVNMTVGIVGFGRIGREVASRLRPFKCKIFVFDPVVDESEIRASGGEPVSLETLLGASDLITLHCPSNERTRQMIRAETIARMRDGVLLVNASRGTLVKTDDLVAALRSGKIAAAALDVSDPEPLPPGHPLAAMENVFITAHIASASPQSAVKLRREAAGAVAKAIRGERLANVVNGVT